MRNLTILEEKCKSFGPHGVLVFRLLMFLRNLYPSKTVDRTEVLFFWSEYELEGSVAYVSVHNITKEICLVLPGPKNLWLHFMPKFYKGRIETNYFPVEFCLDDSSPVSLNFYIATIIFHEYAHLIQQEGEYGLKCKPTLYNASNRRDEKIIEKEAEEWARETFLKHLNTILKTGLLKEKELPMGLQEHLKQTYEETHHNRREELVW